MGEAKNIYFTCLKKSIMEFYQKLPKVELHAHINGSIGPSLLRNLVEEYEMKRPGEMGQDYESILKKLQTDETQDMTLAECFLAFKCIHRVSGDEKSVRQIVKNVISSFAADGVVYLELRTTPRAEASSGMTKRSYLSAVLEEIRTFLESSPEIIVRLLVSIDRRKGVDDARDSLDLAQEFRREYGDIIVGLDVSGDPVVGNILDYVEVLEEARRRGLKVSVHLAEVPNEKEVEAFLTAFLPDRIGHGTCLTSSRGGSEAIEKLVVKNRIPLELCPSSNVIGQTVANFSDHHFREWGLERDHPIALCTDDMGVFKTSLSQEYFLIAQHFSLSQEAVKHLARNAVDLIFSDETMKRTIRSKIDEFKIA